MPRNNVPRKVCLLQPYEAKALLSYDIRPDCASGRHAHLSHAEVGEMMLMGALEFIQHRTIEFGKVAIRKTARVSKPDHGTIRESEMQANMGVSRTARISESKKRELVAEGKLNREEDYTERSQAKIGWWPFIADKKSPTVVPRVAAQDIYRAIDLHRQELSPRDGV